jgi:ABC-type branched-subunit amino acid transport system ATPase component
MITLYVGQKIIMKITKIEIDKLFGFFNHSVQLHTDDRITIIHGPNGVGKTTLLKLVQDIFNLRFDSLLSVRYNKFQITLDDSRRLLIKKKTGEEKQVTPQIFISLYKGKKKEHEYILSSEKWDLRSEYSDMPLDIIDDIIPNLSRIGRIKWQDISTGELLSLREVVYRYGESLPPGFRKPEGIPDWLRGLINSISVHFIQTQRLISIQRTDERRRYVHESPLTQTTVEKYAKNLSYQIQVNLEKSGTVATSLDRTFPHRLLEKSVPSEATEERIRERYQSQSEFRNRLMKAGLIDAEEQVALPKGKIQESARKVLWYYLDDVEKKLEVFGELLGKAELLLDIINSRFNYKTFTLDKNEGFEFSTNEGERVPLAALSSGEQHELVLAYELLFEVRGNSLILIDEPELSLHVTWQHKFLDDIERISKLADLDFLVATQSPSIVNKRRDLMVPLGGGEDA